MADVVQLEEHREATFESGGVARSRMLEAFEKARLVGAHVVALENCFVNGASSLWPPAMRRERLAELVAKTLLLRELLNETHAQQRRLQSITERLAAKCGVDLPSVLEAGEVHEPSEV